MQVMPGFVSVWVADTNQILQGLWGHCVATKAWSPIYNPYTNVHIRTHTNTHVYIHTCMP